MLSRPSAVSSGPNCERLRADRQVTQCARGARHYNAVMIEGLFGAVLVFCLRITDVSIGTLRMIETVRGRRVLAALLGFVEALIFIAAISTVLTGPMNGTQMVGYAAGFACGTLLGISIERWMARGHLLLRVISREHAGEVVARLWDAGFAVTVVEGEGRDGPRRILFMVIPRRKYYRVMDIIEQVDAEAFVLSESVSHVVRAYVPQVTPATFRK